VAAHALVAALRPAGIVAAIDATAARDPGRIAVIDRGRRVAYGALAQASRRAAAWLHRQGIATGDAVGLTVREEFAHLVFCLALLRLGCVQVSLASHEPLPMRAALAARLRLAAVIVAAPDEAPGGVATLRPDMAAIAADAALDVLPLPAAPGACVFASSGTTGRPRLVLMTEGVLAAQCGVTAGAGQVRLRLATNEFGNGKRLQLQTLWLGGTEVLVNNAADRSLAETCAVLGVDRVNLAPLRAERLAEELARPGAAPWPRGTIIAIGGGRVPGPLRAALQERATRQLHVILGCTEAGGIATAGPDDHALDPDTVGFPFPSTEVQVVDEAGRVLPPGEPGFVRVRGAGCVAGYLDDPEATARFFRDGWFHPGDVCHALPGGALVFDGRGDDMMNLDTIKIFPAEIEAVAEGFPGIVECAAFPLRSAGFGDIPMLAVVARDGFDEAALMAHCRARLGLRAPRRVVRLPALPRSGAGKVLRRELPGLVTGGA
jgi:long-chain acyl-CoA synthetase